VERVRLAGRTHLGFPLVRDFSYIEGRSLYGPRIGTESGDK
jgi:hypothetical protein